MTNRLDHAKRRRSRRAALEAAVSAPLSGRRAPQHSRVHAVRASRRATDRRSGRSGTVVRYRACRGARHAVPGHHRPPAPPRMNTPARRRAWAVAPNGPRVGPDGLGKMAHGCGIGDGTERDAGRSRQSPPRQEGGEGAAATAPSPWGREVGMKTGTYRRRGRFRHGCLHTSGDRMQCLYLCHTALSYRVSAPVM